MRISSASQLLCYVMSYERPLLSTLRMELSRPTPVIHVPGIFPSLSSPKAPPLCHPRRPLSGIWFSRRQIRPTNPPAPSGDSRNQYGKCPYIIGDYDFGEPLAEKSGGPLAKKESAALLLPSSSPKAPPLLSSPKSFIPDNGIRGRIWFSRKQIRPNNPPALADPKLIREVSLINDDLVNSRHYLISLK